MAIRSVAPALINDAGVSPDGRYRYWLTRCTTNSRYVLNPRYVNFICLNPSTADANKDDPTVRRLAAFARSWRYDGFWLTNLFAYRATDPFDLCMAQIDIMGPDNWEWLREVAHRAALVVAAWGAVDGLMRNNVRFAQRQAHLVTYDLGAKHPLHILGLTKHGFPRHPLYLKSDTQPMRWTHDAA